MDAKTLASILGHTNASFTLDIYAHATEEMQRQAAANIDRGIGKAEPQTVERQAPDKTMTTFQAQKGKRRRAGTGYLKEIRPGCWEGRYSPVWPDGKKHSRDVYGKTKGECEAKLEELITQMRRKLQRSKPTSSLSPTASAQRNEL